MNASENINSFTLEPVDNDRLANLCGQFDDHLRQIEQSLKVEISNRGNTFNLKGEKASVAQAGELLKELYDETESETITAKHIHLYLQSPRDDVTIVAEDKLKGKNNKSHMVSIVTKRGVVKGRGSHQQEYLDNIVRHDINFGIGPAGTGKTYLAVACAVEALEKQQVQRVLLVRPAVEAGERLGFLPGDLAQKVDPYLRPLYDALYEMLGYEKVEKYIERNIIEIAPLAYMRGRTLNESFIILDEAQNTTEEQMKMFLTRIGFGSTAVITGDITQVDLPRSTKSGLRQVIDVLEDVEDISFCFFDAKDVVRHPLVQKIVTAYDKYEQR